MHPILQEALVYVSEYYRLNPYKDLGSHQAIGSVQDMRESLKSVIDSDTINHA